MARFVVTTRRDARGAADTASALEVAATIPGISVVSSDDPQAVTIDATTEEAQALRERYGATHIVEPEIRRGLN